MAYWPGGLNSSQAYRFKELVMQVQQNSHPGSGWLSWLLQHWSFYQQINVSQWDLDDEEFLG